MADRIYFAPDVASIKNDLPFQDRPLSRLLQAVAPTAPLFIDDFWGDLVKAEWATATSGTASAALVATADKANGEANMHAGTDDNGYSLATLRLNHRGDLNALMVARIQVDAITSVKIEVGFGDDIDDAGYVNALDTPSATADDAAVFVFDTDATVDEWHTFYVAAAGTPVATALGVAPVAATYETFLVALEGSGGRFLRFDANERLIYDSGWIASVITATDLLTPWLFVQARAGSADRILTADYMACWQRRTTAAIADIGA